MRETGGGDVREIEVRESSHSMNTRARSLGMWSRWELQSEFIYLLLKNKIIAIAL